MKPWSLLVNTSFEDMSEIILEGAEIRSESDFHDLISAALDFGPYYGRSLDALWDLLTTEVERPIQIIWKKSGISQASMGIMFEEIVSLIKAVADRDSGRPVGQQLQLILEP